MEIYQPAEDSYLMSKILKEKLPDILNKNPNLTFLEIGAGSGINLETILNLGIKKENILSCDINQDSVNHCKKLGFNCIYSDLFQNIKGIYDVIIFNPPYLPHEEDEPKESQISTTGGKRGNEIIINFLKQAKSHLKKDGLIFLITSSLSPKINFKKLGYFSKEISHENFFFEKIYIWEISKLNKN
jgi:release factor glutamine methyltransferase